MKIIIERIVVEADDVPYVPSRMGYVKGIGRTSGGELRIAGKIPQEVREVLFVWLHGAFNDDGTIKDRTKIMRNIDAYDGGSYLEVLITEVSASFNQAKSDDYFVIAYTHYLPPMKGRVKTPIDTNPFKK